MQTAKIGPLLPQSTQQALHEGGNRAVGDCGDEYTVAQEHSESSTIYTQNAPCTHLSRRDFASLVLLPMMRRTDV